MNKRIARLIVCLAMAPLAAGSLYAVWPPATSLEEPQSQSVTPKTIEDASPTLPRPRGIVDKLEEDERRLEAVLRDLQNDAKELKHDGDHKPDSKTEIK